MNNSKNREWNADLVLGPRPNDRHPDHRYTGVLAQGRSLVAPLKRNPMLLPMIPKA